MKQPELVEMRTRRIGEESVITKQVPKESVKEFRSNGWACHGETIPDPPPPDVEVLELRVKDAESALKAAQHGVSIAQGRLHDAQFQYRSAKECIAREPEIKARLDRKAEIDGVRQRTLRMLIDAGNQPIPFARLLSVATSDAQVRYVKEMYFSDSHVIGKTESGDSLIVENKGLYLKQKAEQEARELAEKEAVIRARMGESA